MKLFLLISGFALVCWGILQLVVLVLTLKAWGRNWSRISQFLLKLVLLPTAFLLDLLDRSNSPLRIHWFIAEVPTAIFIILGLMLLGIGVFLR